VGGVFRPQPLQEDLQLLAVKRVERQQFLDGIYNGHGIGLDITLCRARGFVEVMHPCCKRDLFTDNLLDANALQTLDQHLQMAVHPLHPVDPADAAYGSEIGGFGLFRGWRIGHDDTEDPLALTLHRLQGGCPVLGFHQQGNGLTRKEGAAGDG